MGVYSVLLHVSLVRKRCISITGFLLNLYLQRNCNVMYGQAKGFNRTHKYGKSNLFLFLFVIFVSWPLDCDGRHDNVYSVTEAEKCIRDKCRKKSIYHFNYDNSSDS